MKRTIMLLMALLILFVSVGGCWPWQHEGDRGGGHGGPDRDESPRGPGVPDGGGPGGSGGGH